MRRDFRNFASEQEAERNLQLMEGVFERAATRASSFLSPEEVKAFHEFRTKALEGNRMSLAVNRKTMAPGSK